MNQLEREEQLREEAGFYDYKMPELSETMREIEQLAKQIREKKFVMKDEARIMKASTKPIMPRTAAAKTRNRSVTKLKEQMEDLGVDMEDTENVSVIYNLSVFHIVLIQSLYFNLLMLFRNIIFYINYN